MKAAFLVRDVPAPNASGYKKRNFYLIKALAERKIDVMLFIEAKDYQDCIELKHFCIDVRLNIEMSKARSFFAMLNSPFSSLPYAIRKRKHAIVKEKLRSSAKDIDLLICDGLHKSLNMPFDTSVPTMLYEHNVESEIVRRYAQKERNIFKKIYAFIEYHKFVNLQRKMWNKFDCVITCSEPDKKLMESMAPNADIRVINNGVDTVYFNQDSRVTEKYRLVYTGQIGWGPNEDALLYFVKKIYPIVKQKQPDTRLSIVGSDPSAKIRDLARRDTSITITGFVQDVREYMSKAHVYIAPIRIGSGTRLKLLEAMSMGKPIVSTSVGCEGLDVKDNKHLLVRDDPVEFANAVLDLFKNDELCRTLGENGRRLAVEKYDWHRVFSGLDGILKEIRR